MPSYLMSVARESSVSRTSSQTPAMRLYPRATTLQSDNPSLCAHCLPLVTVGRSKASTLCFLNDKPVALAFPNSCPPLSLPLTAPNL